MKKLIFIASLMLAGCQTVTANDYAPTKNAPQFDKDAAACEMEANKVKTTHGFGGLAGISALQESYNNQYDACMRSKGYQKKNR